MKGKRKTQDPCSTCGLHKQRCMCLVLPQLELKTRVLVVAHYKELRRTTNTGKLIKACLVNSELVTRGEQDSPPLNLENHLEEAYEPYLLYPSEDALCISQIKSQKPVLLIVPDGNWRQASKVHYRHNEIAHLHRVKISLPADEEKVMRKETKENGLSTLKAAAYALGVLEGKSVENKLLQVYEEKLLRTLKGRGESLESFDKP